MSRVSAIVVGTGSMARHHIKNILSMRNTKLVGFVEVSEHSIQAVQALYSEAGKRCPPFYVSIKDLVKAQGAADTAFIVTPHSYHLENALDCMKAGMDVFLEKPMVINGQEAKRMIRARDRYQRLLVVAFPGSLSPTIQKAKELINKGEIGRVTSISANVYQGWKRGTVGTWRQVPEISGGGFLFDTGSHMINTVVDIAQQDVKHVMALMDNCGTPVEINSTISGMFADGSMFSLAGAGDSLHCSSEVLVIGDQGTIRTGIWGERLEIKKAKGSDFKPVKTRRSKGVWEQFIRVRSGKQENPCPPEIGLRFAKLMDMIRKSADTGKKVTSRISKKT
ncbi:MAG: Gfo/Idh/MocA family oxidoreductase [Lentisphaeria bacterium]|nr:Gfo/Idh/MocA family oxidoreductase [Lentisphaeria bacterium]